MDVSYPVCHLVQRVSHLVLIVLLNPRPTVTAFEMGHCLLYYPCALPLSFIGRERYCTPSEYFLHPSVHKFIQLFQPRSIIKVSRLKWDHQTLAHGVHIQNPSFDAASGKFDGVECGRGEPGPR
jgi:hypothetical protein